MKIIPSSRPEARVGSLRVEIVIGPRAATSRTHARTLPAPAPSPSLSPRPAPAPAAAEPSVTPQPSATTTHADRRRAVRDQRVERARPHAAEIERMLADAAGLNGGRWPRGVHRIIAAALKLPRGVVWTWIRVCAKPPARRAERDTLEAV